MLSIIDNLCPTVCCDGQFLLHLGKMGNQVLQRHIRLHLSAQSWWAKTFFYFLSFSLLLFILFFILLLVSILSPLICNVTKCCSALLDSGIPVPAPTVLPRGWVKLANDSYKVLPQNCTWPEARMQCEAEEGQLASTLDELSAAYLELQALKLQTPLWIGLNRNEVQYKLYLQVPQTPHQNRQVIGTVGFWVKLWTLLY